MLINLRKLTLDFLQDTEPTRFHRIVVLFLTRGTAWINTKYLKESLCLIRVTENPNYAFWLATAVMTHDLIGQNLSSDQGHLHFFEIHDCSCSYLFVYVLFIPPPICVVVRRGQVLFYPYFNVKEKHEIQNKSRNEIFKR